MTHLALLSRRPAPDDFAARRVCFAVTAELDPSVLSRVVELFALRGLIPVEVNATREDGTDPHLRIELAADGLDEAECAHLSRRMAAMVMVREVTLEPI